MHSLPLHRKNTLPCGESNVRKFEWRETPARSGYFCSSTSEYSVKKREADTMSASRMRLNSIRRLEFFCSKVAYWSPSHSAAISFARGSSRNCFNTSFQPNSPKEFSSSSPQFSPGAAAGISTFIGMGARFAKYISGCRICWVLAGGRAKTEENAGQPPDFSTPIEKVRPLKYGNISESLINGGAFLRTGVSARSPTN